MGGTGSGSVSGSGSGSGSGSESCSLVEYSTKPRVSKMYYQIFCQLVTHSS